MFEQLNYFYIGSFVIWLKRLFLFVKHFNIHVNIIRSSLEKYIIKDATLLKMVVFETHRQIFTLLCILPTPTNPGKTLKFLNIFLSFLSVMSLSVSLIASAHYFIKFIDTDLKGSISAIFTSFITMGVLYTHFVAYFYRQRVKNVLNGFQACYDSCT